MATARSKVLGLAAPDYLLIGATIALLVIGTLMVYSSSFVVAHNEFDDALYFLNRQVAAIGLGAVLMFIAARVDYRRWRTLSLIAMLVTLAMLVLVLVPGVGAASYGSVRWLKAGPFQVQPSEIAKLAIALYLADWLARRGSHLSRFGSGSLPFAIIVIIVAGLVELQPDLGTTFVIVATAACVFFVAGANLLHVGVLGSGGILVGIALISRMSGYRQNRISAFLDPFADVQGHGWHTVQTLIALGSGGMFGMGLGASHQKFYWVPNAHTDAIFAIIGEELGFVGTFGVLALFGILAWRGFTIAWQAPDTFGRLFATGLTATITVQAIVNFAVVTNSVPYTGVTLPLLSYGGSSTVVTMVGIGLLLSISRFRGQQFDEEEPNPGPAPSPSGERIRPAARRQAQVPPARAHAVRSAVSRLGGFASASQAKPVRRRTLGVTRGETGRRRRFD